MVYAPPGEDEPSLWLPTPQDLVCVSEHDPSQQEANDDEPGDFTKAAKSWTRMARLQPLDQENAAWKHLGLDPHYFDEKQLAPMVPPGHLADGDEQVPKNIDRNQYLERLADDKREVIAGKPASWIRADALVRYLNGEVIEHSDNDNFFQDDPWSSQVLPHIKVQSGTRQVADEDGYFTEVSIRMHPHWQLVAGISAELDSKVVRLGGEGHRALISRLDKPPKQWQELQQFCTPQTQYDTAYVLTPGLAEVISDSQVFSLIPHQWESCLRSCTGEKPLFWGGMSVFQKNNSKEKTVAYQPQRAFIRPGTVYRFHADKLPTGVQPSDEPPKLLPDTDDKWITTFSALNYGTLLWGR